MPKTISWPPIRVFAVVTLAVAANLALPTLMDRPPNPAQLNPAASRNDHSPGALIDLIVAPDTVRAVTPDEARRINASMPNSTLPIRPSSRFFAPVADVESYGRALDCLTAAIYYEAAFESGPGQAAVAQVILNRMRHPAYPKTVCGVVFQGSDRKTGCQFTFTCDGALGRPPTALGWARARAVAGATLNGAVASGVGMATHYHADFVVPYWAPRLVKIGQIGAHIFYRWPGNWGLPSAFTGRYGALEPVVAKMSVLSSFTEPTTGAELVATPLSPDLPPQISPLPGIPGGQLLTATKPVTQSGPAPFVPTTQPTAVDEPVRPQASPHVINDPLNTRPAASQRTRRIPTPDS